MKNGWEKHKPKKRNSKGVKVYKKKGRKISIRRYSNDGRATADY